MRHVALTLLLAVTLSACGDDPTSTSAQPPDLGDAPYDMQRARLPWPAPDKGFTFEGHLRAMGAPMGNVTLTATPRSDAPGWKTTMSAKIDAMGMSMDSTALFDRYFTPSSGTYAEGNASGTNSSKWQATDKGLEIRASAKESDEPTVLEHDGAFVTGVMELLLFSRLADFPAEKFEVAIVDIDSESLNDGTWSCARDGTWNNAPAIVLSGTRSDNKTLEAGFDPTSGELLGVKMTEGQQVFEFVRGPAPKQSNNFFQRPATNAQEAAAQAALAFATADMELLERVVHWPSVYEDMVANRPEAAMGVEKMKAIMLKNLGKTLEAKGTAEMLGPILQGLAPSLKTTGNEDETIVEFGSNFREMKLTVGKRDGTWHLLKLPEN